MSCYQSKLQDLLLQYIRNMKMQTWIDTDSKIVQTHKRPDATGWYLVGSDNIYSIVW